MKLIALFVCALLLGSGKTNSVNKKLKLGILKNSPSMISEALKMGANPNQEVRPGRSLLMEASYKGRFNQVKELIKNGANVNYIGSGIQSALINAVNGGSLKVVKHLVENGAKVNHQNKKGSTPLLIAVLKNQLEMVKYLLSKGADPTKPGLGKKDIRSMVLETNDELLKELFKIKK